MANCNICSGKIGIMDGDIPLSIDHRDIKICRKCYDIKSKFISNRNSKNDNEYQNAKSYFEELLSRGVVSDTAVAPLIDFIKQNDTVRNDTIKKNDEELKAEKLLRETKEKNLALVREKKKNFMFSTGYNFEGYSIIGYKNVVSSEVVLGTGFFSEIAAQWDDMWGTTSSPFEQKIASAKKDAKDKLMICAIAEGGNALIGIDFDLMTIGNNMIVVSASGTAVIIEKDEHTAY